MKEESLLDKARKRLTLKRQKFCEEYIIDGNGQRSALAADCPKPSAAAQAGNMLKIPEVIDYLRLLRLSQQRRTDSDGDKVVEEFAKIGYSNIRNYYKTDGSLIPITDLPEDIAAAIQSVKETEYKASDNTSKVIREYKLHSKIDALKELGSHHDIYNQDKNKKPAKLNIGITINRGKKKDGD